MKTAAAYTQAFIRLSKAQNKPVEDMLEELLKLVIADASQSELIGQMMMSIDETLEDSQIPDDYYHINTFYLDHGYDDPNEVSTRLHAKLTETRLLLGKLRGATRSYRKARRTTK